MTPGPDSVSVRVPATAANMGPGFDCIGMAVDLWNELTVARGPFAVEISGEGESALPRDDRNLVVRGAKAAFEAFEEPFPDLTFTCLNRIPYARGLGSSSAATVSGLLAGFALMGRGMDTQQALEIAANIEGHPDNVAPAILGGCQVGVRTNSHWVTQEIPLPEDLRAVVLIPEMQGDTAIARAVLPTEVSRAEAVFNIGRAALLVNALRGGRLDLLRYATEDRLHQPARADIYEGLNSIIQAALDGGAHGAFLAGAGPTVMALTTGREQAVAAEMTEAARRHGLESRSEVLSTTTVGAHLVEQT